MGVNFALYSVLCPRLRDEKLLMKNVESVTLICHKIYGIMVIANPVRPLQYAKASHSGLL